MSPEDRAAADNLWSLLDQTAEAITAFHSRKAGQPAPRLRLDCAELQLLSRERAYWRDQADRRLIPITTTVPPPEAIAPQPAPEAAMATVEPARRIRPGMSEAARRAASERMTALRATQRARGQAAAVVEAPTTAAVATPASPPPAVAPQPMAETQANPARMQRLSELWMNADLTLRDLLHAVNSLPGPQVGAATSLYRWAARLGLPTTRPAPLAAPQQTTAAVSPEPKPQPPPPPPPPPEAAAGARPKPPAAPAPPPVVAQAPTPTAPRRPIKPDDVWEDAREMLRAGIPVITVAEETGLTTGQVRDLKFGMAAPAAARAAPPQ